MWGAKVSEHPTITRNIGRIMKKIATSDWIEADQSFLSFFVWPVIRHDAVTFSETKHLNDVRNKQLPSSPAQMIHDSYFCARWDFNFYGLLTVHPFPTKRNGFAFVGGQSSSGSNEYNSSQGLKHCPLQCRPSYGKDWNYC